mmetsp:Transcript_8812/g.21749  ORF Transcript_8812/g.21749 Transcript_8812/m.21749 type:complete len:292 (+) Transcript_8812:635-1510(+)
MGSTIDRSSPGESRMKMLGALPLPNSDCRRRTPNTKKVAASSSLTISQVCGSLSRTPRSTWACSSSSAAICKQSSACLDDFSPFLKPELARSLKDWQRLHLSKAKFRASAQAPKASSPTVNQNSAESSRASAATSWFLALLFPLRCVRRAANKTFPVSLQASPRRWRNRFRSTVFSDVQQEKAVIARLYRTHEATKTRRRSRLRRGSCCKTVFASRIAVSMRLEGATTPERLQRPMVPLDFFRSLSSSMSPKMLKSSPKTVSTSVKTDITSSPEACPRSLHNSSEANDRAK